MKIKLAKARSLVRKRYLLTLIRVFIFFLCTTVFSFTTESSYSQQKVIIDQDMEVTVNEVFQIIKDQTQYRFLCPDNLFINSPKIKIKKGEIRLSELLNETNLGSNITIELSKNNTIVLKKTEPNQIVDSIDVPQEIEISGTVLDEDGQPLPGVSVLVQGTTRGTETDFDGVFSLEVTKGDVIVLSFIGMVSQEITIGEETSLDVTLVADTSALDEVVVVGYGEQSVKKVTSAISQVSGEELRLDDRPVTNIQSALIGSLPGLKGLNSNGRPGSMPGFSIRGNSTLNSSSILIIIDEFEGSMGDVNPQDVESVTILKDAAAVAIYGARGANGVMLITTKKAKRDRKISVSYNFIGSMQNQSELADMLSSSELVAFENFAVTGDPTGGGSPSAPYNQNVIDLANSGFYPETQWPDELYKSSAGQQSHNISVQGGTENTGFLINAGHLNQDGLALGPDNFKRQSLRLKIDTDINKWLSIGTNTIITNRIVNSTPATGGSGLLGSPFYPVKTIDGIYTDKGSPGNPNPIGQAESGTFTKAVRDAVNVQLYAKINPLKGLFIEQRVSIDKSNVNSRAWTNVYDYVHLDLEDPDSYTNPESPNRNYVPGQAEGRRLTLTSSTGYKFRALTKVNYNLSLDNHNFGILLGFQSTQGESEWFSTGRRNFFLDNLIDLKLGQEIDPNIGGGIGNTSGRGGNATTLSYFGRFNYDYKGRYIAELSFRYDGSSNFLETNQYGFFPSASFAWNIAEETFMEKTDFIDKLKLRASYGQSGDDSGVGRRVTQLASIDITGYPIGGEIQPAIYLGPIASRDLKWETSTTFNTGLDFSLWNGKLQVNSEYFITNRDDILSQIITPVEFGFGNVPANYYSVKSWGWELELSHKNNIGSDFSYWANGFITHYDNEITDLKGREFPNFAEGQSINDRFGFETDGFFNNQEEIDAHVSDDGVTQINQGNVGGTYIGGYKFMDQITVDTDNDGIPDSRDGVINGDDKVILERNSASDLNIGFNLGFSYKNFTLSTHFYGILDRNQWWSGADAHEPFLNNTNAFSHQLNYWKEGNPNAFFPIPQGNGIQGYASDVSHLIYDNEFIKLQNVTLSYDFSEKLIESLRYIKNMNVVFTAENVGTVWTNSPAHEYGWDPELGVGNVDYPLPFTISIGVNVKF